MEMKKRILSAAILLTALGAGLTYASKHPYYPENVVMEGSLDDENTPAKTIVICMEIGEDGTVKYGYRELSPEEASFEANERNASPFIVYNSALEGNRRKLDMDDIAFLSCLRDNQSMVALNSTIGHYNTVSLDSDGTLVVGALDSKPRVADRAGVENDYYCDILTGIYASDILTEEERESAIPFGEFVKQHDLAPVGFCLPNVGKCEASEDALKAIEEVYGKDVAGVVREKGLPVPFYSYESIYDVYSYSGNPVKGLTN